MNNSLLSIQNVTVQHLDQVLFKDLSFEIKRGQQWALVGNSGSGKSALLQTIAGKFNITGGDIRHHYFEDRLPLNQTGTNATHHQLIAMVAAKHSFRNLSNTTNFYYQQRFNSSDSEDAPTVAAYIAGVKTSAQATGFWTLALVIERLKLGTLLDKQLIKLSNGETKRLLIAAALIKNPVLMLLDNPLTGLDVQTRIDFNTIIADAVLSGITVVMATSPDEIPDAITHVATLHQGQIIRHMPKAEFVPAVVGKPVKKAIDTVELQSLLSASPNRKFSHVVKMDKVNITYGDKQILHNVNWTVKQGEHWALLGPNGAGKSTLLSLVNGDNPQAYANDIVLFDRKRGTGESIWDIKSKIGFVSPELHQYFPVDNSCQQVIESGFYDTLGLFRPSQPQKAAVAMRWMKLFKFDTEALRPFKGVSASKQRLVLLARALVKNPDLLIFDEPCQGLDAQQQLHFKHMVDSICTLGDTTLIYVTHYAHEIPDSVDLILRLDQGHVVLD